ncbi:hypothetical protein B0H19DRAFT_1065859 [Mycena capillaripes]|nr:hypothetical protein B0H19DRAFT_1065859 [Mycena capillaripes]
MSLFRSPTERLARVVRKIDKLLKDQTRAKPENWDELYNNIVVRRRSSEQKRRGLKPCCKSSSAIIPLTAAGPVFIDQQSSWTLIRKTWPCRRHFLRSNSAQGGMREDFISSLHRLAEFYFPLVVWWPSGWTKTVLPPYRQTARAVLTSGYPRPPPPPPQPATASRIATSTSAPERYGRSRSRTSTFPASTSAPSRIHHTQMESPEGSFVTAASDVS